MKEPFDFGSTLRRIRKQKGYTQKRLAEVLNLSETTISKYESNTASPPFETVCEIAAWFNIPLDYFSSRFSGETIVIKDLNIEQKEIVSELVSMYSDKNATRGKGLLQKHFELLGKIVASLT